MAPTAGRRTLGVRQPPGLAGGGALEGAMPRGFVASAPMRRIGVRLGGGLMGSCVRSGVSGGRVLLGARVGLNNPCIAAGFDACLVGLTGSCCILRCHTQTTLSMSLDRSVLHKILPCRWTRVEFRLHVAMKVNFLLSPQATGSNSVWRQKARACTPRGVWPGRMRRCGWWQVLSLPQATTTAGILTGKPAALWKLLAPCPPACVIT